MISELFANVSQFNYLQIYFHLQSKPIIADPIDFEGFVLKNKTLIQNDPQRELLMYPNDDVSVSPRRFSAFANLNPITFSGNYFASQIPNGGEWDAIDCRGEIRERLQQSRKRSR